MTDQIDNNIQKQINAIQFKKLHTFEKRKEESDKILKKYDDRYPIIVAKSNDKNAASIPNIDKMKFLVPGDLTIAQFMYVIRKRVKLSPEQALWIFTNHGIPPTSQSIMSIYQTHKDEDGFLYLIYSGDNVFGN